MKTSIAHNNNVSLSKGILISADIHNSAAYVLLDGNRGYILRAENQEEEERIAAFVDQLQIGAYVFAYLTYNGRIMKLFLRRQKVFLWKLKILHDRLKLAEEQKTNRKIRFGKVCSLLFFSR